VFARCIHAAGRIALRASPLAIRVPTLSG
jgi:hypothetical protein